jgi:hypothetical protein
MSAAGRVIQWITLWINLENSEAVLKAMVRSHCPNVCHWLQNGG